RQSSVARLQGIDRGRRVVEEREVGIGAEQREELASLVRPLTRECREERRGVGRVRLAELRRLVAETRKEHVEVAHVPESRAKLAQPSIEPARVGDEERTAGAEEYTEAADADTHVMEALRVAAEPRAGVVALDLAELCPQPRLELLEWRVAAL